MAKKRQERKARQRLREAQVEGARSDEELGEEAVAKIEAKLKAGEPVSETEIRAAGLKIDLPFEAPPPSGEPVIKYADGSSLAERWLAKRGGKKG